MVELLNPRKTENQSKLCDKNHQSLSSRNTENESPIRNSSILSSQRNED